VAEEVEHLEDLALIARFNTGEADALGELVKRHGRAVYSFIYRFLGTDSAIDDVYQEVWIRVIRSVARFKGGSRFTTWLFQITRNICIDTLRKRKRRGKMLSLEDSRGTDGEGSLRDLLTASGPSVGEMVSSQEFQESLTEAIQKLPEDQREVFLLRRNTALTFDEISELSGVPRNTVKSRMRYALQNIRRNLEKRIQGREALINGM